MRTSTILVVDDDRAVRGLAEHILRSEGYRVYVAEGAADAIAIAHQLQCGLDLLLTDMVMPGIDGHDLILSIRRICPHMSTMLMSGGFVADDTRSKNYKIVRKPFTTAQLLAAVKEILDAHI